SWQPLCALPDVDDLLLSAGSRAALGLAESRLLAGISREMHEMADGWLEQHTPVAVFLGQFGNVRPPSLVLPACAALLHRLAGTLASHRIVPLMKPWQAWATTPVQEAAAAQADDARTLDLTFPVYTTLTARGVSAIESLNVFAWEQHPLSASLVRLLLSRRPPSSMRPSRSTTPWLPYVSHHTVTPSPTESVLFCSLGGSTTPYQPAGLSALLPSRSDWPPIASGPVFARCHNMLAPAWDVRLFVAPALCRGEAGSGATPQPDQQVPCDRANFVHPLPPPPGGR
ncbi:hypothetical protein QBC44DRAFT_388800, partial [Cladorrhinum sp. PSN332]